MFQTSSTSARIAYDAIGCHDVAGAVEAVQSEVWARSFLDAAAVYTATRFGYYDADGVRDTDEEEYRDQQDLTDLYYVFVETVEAAGIGSVVVSDD